MDELAKEYGLHRCKNCGGRFEKAEFYYLRTLGVACKFCVLSVTGHESIEEFQREQFRPSNPRRG